jgi:mannosyltransferase
MDLAAVMKGEERPRMPPAGVPKRSPVVVGSRGVWLALALVTLLGLGLRLYQIGAEGLLPDEGISIQRVRDFHWDPLRPLYFLVLWLWIRLGDSEGMLRLPSALMGAATIPLVYLMGQRLFTPRAGLIAALLVAVSPLHLNHSQEIRMYSQMTLLATASWFFFWLLLEEGKPRNFLVYGAATLGTLLTQPISLFLLAAQSVYLLLWWRRHRRLATWWLVAQVGVLLLALSNIREMAVQVHAFAQDWTSVHGSPGLRDAVQLVSEFSFWKRSLYYVDTFRTARLVYYALFLGVLALLAAAPLMMRKRAEQVTLVLAWFAVPMLCVFAASHTAVNIWQSRYLLYVLPAYALLLGFSVDGLLARFRAGWAGLVLIGAVVLASLAIDARYYTQSVREDWHSLFAYLRTQRQSRDGFGIYTDQAGPAFGYYYARIFGETSRKRGPEKPAVDEGRATNRDNPAAAAGRGIVGTGGEDWVPLLLQPRVFRELTPAELRTLFAELPRDRPRYWLVLTHHEHRGGESIKQYVEQHYEVLAKPSFRYIEVLLFQPRKTHGA